jgi:hypothetical protein
MNLHMHLHEKGEHGKLFNQQKLKSKLTQN